jgi:hypothetical protein
MHAIVDASIPTLLPLLPMQCDKCNPQTRASLIAAAQAMSWKTSQPEANTTPHTAQHRARVAPQLQHSKTFCRVEESSENTIVMLTSARRKIKISLRRMLREEWLAGGTAMHRGDSQMSKRQFFLLFFPSGFLLPFVPLGL